MSCDFVIFTCGSRGGRGSAACSRTSPPRGAPNAETVAHRSGVNPIVIPAPTQFVSPGSRHESTIPTSDRGLTAIAVGMAIAQPQGSRIAQTLKPSPQFAENRLPSPTMSWVF